jgi:acyl carrier protein|tara:strand:+ start:412 stop:654 length:243 start_codon:yes stop_codon:yes gene_type:complete
MSTLAKYKQIFSSVFSLKDDYDFDKLNYQDIPEWDSIGHMTLVSELENEFSISIETDDIVDFSSFKKGIELLKKYKVNIN